MLRKGGKCVKILLMQSFYTTICFGVQANSSDGRRKITCVNFLSPLRNKLLRKEVVMVLTEKETAALKDLQSQEKICAKKYEKYSQQAKDPELKNLFETIQKEEQKHYDSLGQVLDGTVPECDCNDSNGKDYTPKATYMSDDNSEDKMNDSFLATDCIGTEKLVSSEYNTDVFVFGEPGVRKLLADIQVEEQNHAEMLYKYKTVNRMS